MKFRSELPEGRRYWLLAGVCAAVAAWSTVACIDAASGQSPSPPAQSVAQAGLDRLVAAYPDYLLGIDGNELVWKDGTRMGIDDGLGAKAHAARLETSDIKDMLIEPYPAGAAIAPPGFEQDPGRARNAAFFDKMYGRCTAGETQKDLIEVVWLPKKWGKPVKITRVNGVAEKLATVSRELDALPSSFDRYLFPPAGTFNCRAIAGTTRQSAHGHGIAIDLSTAAADYWRWSKPGTDGRPAFRNRFPPEIIAIFEKHGFIWGGRWYHYDTMHFEYRPELVGAGRTRPVRRVHKAKPQCTDAAQNRCDAPSAFTPYERIDAGSPGSRAPTPSPP